MTTLIRTPFIRTLILKFLKKIRISKEIEAEKLLRKIFCHRNIETKLY